jgi:glycosyltransferase involved in cell wall biosynthesis
LKKIFISIPWFSPAFKAGGPVQSISNMVNQLKEGYEFYIYSSNADLHGLPLHITETDSWCNYNANTKVWYAGRNDRSKNLVEQVGMIKPDKLFIIGIFDWHFNLVPLFFCKGVHKILSARGMLHPGALSQKAVKKKTFLQLMKWFGLTKRCSFHATDTVEAGYIRNHFGAYAIIHEAGNFPRWIGPGIFMHKDSGQLHLVSIGIVSAMKNILLVLQALEQCKSAVQFDIYGPVKDALYWENCLQQMKLLPPNIQVFYHKEITPDKVPEKMHASHVFIMPSKSENFGHAIYEALSGGLPVITSEFTPWNGLEVENAGLNVQNDAGTLATAINFFAGMNETAFEKWRRGAVGYAEKAVDEGRLQKEYETMFGS